MSAALERPAGVYLSEYWNGATPPPLVIGLESFPNTRTPSLLHAEYEYGQSDAFLSLMDLEPTASVEWRTPKASSSSIQLRHINGFQVHSITKALICFMRHHATLVWFTNKKRTRAAVSNPLRIEYPSLQPVEKWTVEVQASSTDTPTSHPIQLLAVGSVVYRHKGSTVQHHGKLALVFLPSSKTRKFALVPCANAPSKAGVFR